MKRVLPRILCLSLIFSLALDPAAFSFTSFSNNAVGLSLDSRGNIFSSQTLAAVTAMPTLGKLRKISEWWKSLPNEKWGHVMMFGSGVPLNIQVAYFNLKADENPILSSVLGHVSMVFTRAAMIGFFSWTLCEFLLRRRITSHETSWFRKIHWPEPHSSKTRSLLLLGALFGTLSQAGNTTPFFIAFKYMDSSLVSAIAFTAPVLVLMISWWAKKIPSIYERPTLRSVLGSTLASGMGFGAFVLGKYVAPETFTHGITGIGLGCSVLAMVALSLVVVCQKLLIKQIHPMQLSAIAMAGSLPALALIYYGFAHFFGAASAPLFLLFEPGMFWPFMAISGMYMTSLLLTFKAATLFKTSQTAIWLTFSPVFISTFTWMINPHEKIATYWIWLPYAAGLLGTYISGKKTIRESA